jgi:hypothetical protein
VVSVGGACSTYWRDEKCIFSPLVGTPAAWDHMVPSRSTEDSVTEVGCGRGWRPLGAGRDPSGSVTVVCVLIMWATVSSWKSQPHGVSYLDRCSPWFYLHPPCRWMKQSAIAAMSDGVPRKPVWKGVFLAAGLHTFSERVTCSRPAHVFRMCSLQQACVCVQNMYLATKRTAVAFACNYLLLHK